MPILGGCSSASGCSAHRSVPPAPHIQEKIARHPCYNQDAHHYFARMHVAVAPACNIQCNYCNRKYDCANESRPGVVSEVLKPEEAVKKVLVVAGEIPQMTVVGIAGPGDPLANPEKTFSTFKGIAEQAPDIQLCLSTNGLRLLDYLDQIQELNIDHVTITINAVDPKIGQHIYSWVFFEGKRYKGIEAAEILLERQLKGLEALAERGILCKVNSVLIPGINDSHLEQVSDLIMKKGAFLHNIMPLIVAPGTVFEKEGRRNPTSEELHQVQEKCSGNMKIMRHCRQCRADAIGLLGDDRSAEFTKEKIKAAEPQYDAAARRKVQQELENKMKERYSKKIRRETESLKNGTSPSTAIRIAVASCGNEKVNLHFGHAKEFLIYDVAGDEIRFVGIRKVQAYCKGTANCKTNKEELIQESAEILKDCKIVVTSGIGAEPRNYLLGAGIIPVVHPGDIEEVLLSCSKYFYGYINSKDRVLSRQK